MASTPRILAQGFTTLEGGVDGGKDASLIAANQMATAGNLTVRGALIKTRPPFANLLITDQTNGRATGKFQGAMAYEAESGTSGFILSISGKLFRIQLGNPNVITEITPKLAVIVTADASVPSSGSDVTISVTSETPLTVGSELQIDGGSYTVLSQLVNQVSVQYNGGAAHATIAKGTAVMDGDGNQVYEYQENPSNADFVYLFQAENYAIVLGNQNRTIIYDGASARQAGIGELPPATYGLYAWGRIWLTLPDRRRFIAGDIVYGPSGTPQNGFRDAILKVTENDFLNEGGAFGVPNNAGPITSMFALATQDTSLGIGPILVGTTNSVISCNAPVDRTTWKNLTYPIQTISLLDYGPQGPWCVPSINGDVWYRAANEIRSFIVARRNMDMWGNSPVSREVSNILEKDSTDLLPHASGMYFDNKLFMTVAPYYTQNGIAHRGCVVINFDAVSDLRQKLPAAWEGVYTGLQFLQFLKLRVDGKERGFAFVLNGDAIELWEILRDGNYDQYITDAGITRTPIQSFLETRKDNFGDAQQLKRLYTAEIFVDEIVDNVTLKILYRPDEYPEFTEWTTLNFCASVSQCNPPTGTKFSCSMWKSGTNTYAARVMLTTPTEVENKIQGGFLSSGYEFQFRIEGTGKFRITQFQPQAVADDDKAEGECPTESPTCIEFSSCNLDIFNYDSHG